ncbi:methyltransferase [Actinomadura roseirufa]|uniref:methyltransferase n=1 Tax=Actinomadura roseirufa TaxID=2094049 RepID=UPI0010412191|nr:methyltransferase [Actinomadura roseirufa]
MTSTVPDTSLPSGILKLANGFCDAKAVLTAVELGLFTTLHNAPADVEKIRQDLQLHGRGLADWLDLLVELTLLEHKDGRYHNSTGADRYLVRGQESYIGGFIERSNRNLYPAWGRLSEALRTGESQSGSHFDVVVENPKILAQFINSMDAFTRVLGPQLIQAYDGWADYASVLDVGGCRGALTAQIVKAHPHLQGKVFDLPQMEPFFGELVAEQSLDGRMSFHGGSFFTDPLPSADIVVIGHVLHDWDREQRGYLVRKAYESVSPGGVLLVYDRLLDRASSRPANLVVSLDMLLVTDGGSEYWLDEMREHMTGAGFASVADQELGEDDTLVIARKAR